MLRSAESWYKNGIISRTRDGFLVRDLDAWTRLVSRLRDDSDELCNAAMHKGSEQNYEALELIATACVH